MKEQHYISIIVGCTDPELIGPFDTADEQMVKAKEIFLSDNYSEEYDAIFLLDTDSEGKPSMFSLTNDATDLWKEEHEQVN